MNKQTIIKIANMLANRLIQANTDNNYERLVEINEIVFHLGEILEQKELGFNKKLWRDYIDMIAYNIPLKPKEHYTKGITI